MCSVKSRSLISTHVLYRGRGRVRIWVREGETENYSSLGIKFQLYKVSSTDVLYNIAPIVNSTVFCTLTFVERLDVALNVLITVKNIFLKILGQTSCPLVKRKHTSRDPTSDNLSMQGSRPLVRTDCPSHTETCDALGALSTGLP